MNEKGTQVAIGLKRFKKTFCWIWWEHQEKAIGSYTYLPLNKWYHGVLHMITKIMPAIYQDICLRWLTSRRPIQRPMNFSVLVDFRCRSVTKIPLEGFPLIKLVKRRMSIRTQTAGGTKGFSLKPGAVSKYYIVSEYRSSFLKQLRDLLDPGKTNWAHKIYGNQELQETRLMWSHWPLY